MSKYEEALKRYHNAEPFEIHQGFMGLVIVSDDDEEYNILKEAVDKAEKYDAIYNANPSEALEDFKIIKFKTINAGYNYGYKVWDKIEQALIKAQQQEKVLKIIKDEYKNLLLHYIDDSLNGNSYCGQSIEECKKMAEKKEKLQILKEVLINE